MQRLTLLCLTTRYYFLLGKQIEEHKTPTECDNNRENVVHLSLCNLLSSGVFYSHFMTNVEDHILAHSNPQNMFNAQMCNAKMCIGGRVLVKHVRMLFFG